MYFVMLQFDSDPVYIGTPDWTRTEVELFGPFDTSEQADQWIQDLHPSVNEKPGFHAIITTATPVGREY